MKTGQLLFAYHGCDITLRDDLVSRRISGLNPSANKYDWLGGGAYFFENDYQRALMFASAAQANPTKRFTKQPIATPAVVGAVLQFDFILDMTTQEYSLTYKAMVEYLTKNGQPEPKNSKWDAVSPQHLIYQRRSEPILSCPFSNRNAAKLESCNTSSAVRFIDMLQFLAQLCENIHVCEMNASYGLN